MTLFRHKKSDLFMMVCFIVTFFLVFVVLSYMNNVINTIEVADKHAYESECRLIFMPGEEMPDFERILEKAEGLHGIVLVEDVGMSVDEAGTEYYSSVILFTDEAYKVVSDGELCLVKKTGGADVIIGENFSDYATEDDKLYLDGKEYNVIAVEDDNGGEYSYSILTWYDDLSEFSRRKLVGAEAISIKISSDKYQATEIFSILRDTITELYPDSNVYAEEVTDEIMYDENTEYMRFYITVYLFCVVNCMVAAQFWVEERKREIAIKKAYGFSNIRLFATLYSEFTKVAMVSMIVCLLFKVLTDAFSNNELFAFELSTFNLIFLIIAVLITSLGAILLPVFTISRASSVDQVIKKG